VKLALKLQVRDKVVRLCANTVMLLSNLLGRFATALVRACALLVLLGGSVLAQPQPQPAPVLEVYVRDGCPHCADAKLYLPTLQQLHPGLQIVLRQVDKDPEAAAQLVTLFERNGRWPPGVPAFVYQQRMLVGFQDVANSGPALEQLLLPPSGAVTARLPEWLASLDPQSLGWPLFTLALGLIDGLNPCATWVLLFLLSLLVHLKDRRRMAWIASTFVLVSGTFYFMFMAAWLNAFLLVGLSTPIRLGLATLALGMGAVNAVEGWRGSGRYTLSIPASAKPGIYERARLAVQASSLPVALAAAAFLAVVVNLFELLCTAGFPAIYTAMLVDQGLSRPAQYAYIGLYNLGYILDDAAMVGAAVWALNSRKLTPQGGRLLKLLSGVVMCALGLVMLLRPQWL
jgi:glutaredoxin